MNSLKTTYLIGINIEDRHQNFSYKSTLNGFSRKNGDSNRKFIYRPFRRSSSEALLPQQSLTMIKKDGLQTAAEASQGQSKEFRTDVATRSCSYHTTYC